MDDIEFNAALANFAKANEKTLKVIYGGDGTLVHKWRDEYGKKKNARGFLPIRNYGLCDKHRAFYEKLFLKDDSTDDNNAISLKQILFPTICGKFYSSMDYKLDALSEIVVANDDPTSAIRFNVIVDGKVIVENAIANGLIFAAKLGSTGYFKSVARTMFMRGIGLGFICPTYSLPNIVADEASIVELEVVRDAKLTVTADKIALHGIEAPKGWKINVMDACNNVAIFGYEQFMCPDCRKNRNSALVNDNYFVR